MFPIRIKACSESDLRMLGNLARNIQRVLPVTQADIDAAAALGKGWVVWKVIEVNDPIDNLRGGTQLVIKQNSITPGQNVRRVLIVQGPGGETVVIGPGPSPLLLPDAIANSLSYVKAFGGTEQRDIPDNYLQRQFIYMMDGSYLLTDIVPTYDCRVEIDFATTSLPAGATTILGGRTVTFGGLVFAKGSVGRFVVDAFGTNREDRYGSNVTPAANTRYKFTYDNQTTTLTSGGSTLFTNTFTNTNANGAELAINAMNDNGTIASGNTEIYLYSFKAWDNQGNLIADYVPAVQKGTVPVVGFYDTVSGTFKTATSGTFAAGGEAVPTPDAPMDIVSNNGVLKTQGSATGTVTQTGDPTPTTPVEPVFYQNHGLLLRAIGEDADTYDASTQTITRAIGYHILDGTEAFGTSSAYGKALYINGASSAWGAVKTKDVLCQYFLGSSGPTGSMPEFTCFFNASGHFYFRTTKTATDFKAWLAELYANGTPLIIWFVKNTSTTESFTPSVYADGTVETIEDTIGNTATAEMLLSVGDYTDEQEIISGAVTRNIKVLVLDGTESWSQATTSQGVYRYRFMPTDAPKIDGSRGHCVSTHFFDISGVTTQDVGGAFASTTYLYFIPNQDVDTIAKWTTYLADQYAAGTPVIVIYPLATPTTESVTGQTLQVTDGDNALEITQASLSGLELEAEYTKAE